MIEPTRIEAVLNRFRPFLQADGADIEVVDVPTEWLEGSPFADYFVPSLILLVVVGGSFIVAAIAVFAGLRGGRFAVFLVAFIVLGWLTVQMSIIGYVSPMSSTSTISLHGVSSSRTTCACERSSIQVATKSFVITKRNTSKARG
jgi:hypothetical protein